MYVYAPAVCDTNVSFFEVQIKPINDNKDIITGSIDDAVFDSTLVALTLFRINESSLKQRYHIHFTDSDMYKIGPSAGLAVYLKLLSLKECENSKKMLVTGEIDLMGNVIEVGGFNGKYLKYANSDEFEYFVAPMANYKMGFKGIYLNTIYELNEKVFKNAIQ